jgi:large subunit ribosomal protein L40e
MSIKSIIINNNDIREKKLYHDNIENYEQSYLQPVIGIPIIETQIYQNLINKYVIFEFEICGEKKIFTGYINKNISTNEIYEYILNYLSNQNFINKYEDIDIFDLNKNNIISFNTIYEILKKVHDDIYIFKIKIKKNKKYKKYDDEYKALEEKYSIDTNIFFKKMSGITKNICVDLNMNIYELKVIISNIENILQDDIRLIYNGQQLSDNHQLKTYNIHKYSTIHIVERLRGGMFCEETSGNIDYQKISFDKIDFLF